MEEKPEETKEQFIERIEKQLEVFQKALEIGTEEHIFWMLDQGCRFI